MGGDNVTGEGVRITQREVYDTVVAMSSKLDAALASLADRSKQGDDHETRLKSVEVVHAVQSATIQELKLSTIQHSADLARISGAVARSAWVPGLVTAFVVLAIGALVSFLFTQ
jgi:hypothetical protein